MITFSECVALQDPYCAWDKINGKCKSYGSPRWNDDTVFYQNVQTGQHAACPSGRMASKDSTLGEQKGYPRDRDYDGMRHRDQSGGEVINIMQEKDFNGNGNTSKTNSNTSNTNSNTSVTVTVNTTISVLITQSHTKHFSFNETSQRWQSTDS